MKAQTETVNAAQPAEGGPSPSHAPLRHPAHVIPASRVEEWRSELLNAQAALQRIIEAVDTTGSQMSLGDSLLYGQVFAAETDVGYVCDELRLLLKHHEPVEMPAAPSSESAGLPPDVERWVSGP